MLDKVTLVTALKTVSEIKVTPPAAIVVKSKSKSVPDAFVNT